MKPIETSSEKEEDYFYISLLDKGRKKTKGKFGVLVRTADKKIILSKGHAINWSYNLYTNTENIKDTISSCQVIKLAKRYIEEVSKKSELTMNEIKEIMKIVNIR